MKVRIISGVIGLILLIFVVYFGQITLGIGIFLISLIGIHEFYNAVSAAGYKPIKVVGYVSCLSILFIGLNGRFMAISNDALSKSIHYFSFAVFVMIAVLFSVIIFAHNRYNLNDIALTAFGILYVIFLFSFVVLTRNLENGSFYIWLVFIGAFATDTCALFSGMLFGKTKFLPDISPKKTLEGSIGGIIGCMVLTILYGMFIQRYISNLPLYHFVAIGLLNGILSQVGDWGASAIKRYVKIKDYGKIMPGHGGILDRFDSILFTAPVVYFYISFMMNS